MAHPVKVLIAVTVMLLLVFVVAGNTGASAEPQIVQVTLKDYQINLSQFVVAPGKAVTLVITNAGELPHKLIVQSYESADKANVAASPVIGSHTSQPVQFTLEPGVYRIECEQTDHAKRGMVNVIAAQTTPQKSFPLQMDFLILILGLVMGSAYIIADSLGLRLTAKQEGR
ncbi:MAG: cupredoxin domain-containing protein [Chloroflexi bacterium]|nr:cupredoxin domain-containing protein [Chloroflexota bacterium]